MTTTRKPIKKSALMFMLSMMAITLVLLVAILIVTVSYFMNKAKEPTGVVLTSGEAIYTEEELNRLIAEKEDGAVDEVLDYIRSSMQEGKSTVEILRELYPELTVLVADGKYHFFEPNESLAPNLYANDNFKVDENGIVEYNDGIIASKKGIDVSKFQGNIDWSKVKEDGVEYAFIRVGYRGYGSSGKLVTDETFEDNIKGATSNGVDVGVYFFSQAINEEEAIEEANYVLEAIKGYDVTYPVVIDIEEVTDSDARTADMTQEQWTKNCIAFCETIKAAGYTPMIYGNLKTFFIMLDMTQLEAYDKWFAYYDTPVYFPYEFTIWQYTDEGKVDGISVDVDLNVGFYEPIN